MKAMIKKHFTVGHEILINTGLSNYYEGRLKIFNNNEAFVFYNKKSIWFLHFWKVNTEGVIQTCDLGK